MTGRAYNPKGQEPEEHDRFWYTPDDELMKGFRGLRDKYRTERGGHFNYEKMYDIYAGIEDKLMEGAIDSHLHQLPGLCAELG